MSEQLAVNWEQMVARAGSYPEQAFHFVREGLAYTVETLSKNTEEMEEDDRHVSGQELCLGMRDLAIKRYGPLAGLVLSRWHIHKTEDFGRIVFAMVDSGLMRATAEDSLEDFQNVYEFAEEFNPEQLANRI